MLTGSFASFSRLYIDADWKNFHLSQFFCFVVVVPALV